MNNHKNIRIYFSDGKYVDIPEDKEEQNNLFSGFDEWIKPKLIKEFKENGGEQLSKSEIELLKKIDKLQKKIDHKLFYKSTGIMIDVKKANKNSDKLNLENRINYKLYKNEIDKLIKNNYIRKIGLIQKSYEITEKGYKILRWILFCQKVNKNGE